MRIAVQLVMSVLAGAVVAIGGVLASYWWEHHDDTRYVGWYSPTPLPDNLPRRYVDYLPTSIDGGPDWAALLVPATVVGVVAGLIVFGVVRLVAGRTAAHKRGSGGVG